MQVQELLQFVDEAVYHKTGRHLNDLQRGVIEGTLKYQNYSDIADAFNCSPGHAKDVGYELLKLLSDIFDEPVDKGNLKSVLDRHSNINLSLGDNTINSNIIGCITVSPKQPKTQANKPNSNISSFSEDSKNIVHAKKIYKLRQFGLNDEQIAEALELPLEIVKQVT
ncbi:hypothetical protein [Anabaena sp. CCY 9402-a]|uniref:hypothetical protein n=1 Tax=Anabaena sp. CCY 9402-a TaxID=3103867 RepID=UPI0039C6D659